MDDDKQSVLLEQFFTALASEPNSQPPADLDPASAEIARRTSSELPEVTPSARFHDQLAMLLAAEAVRLKQASPNPTTQSGRFERLNTMQNPIFTSRTRAAFARLATLAVVLLLVGGGLFFAQSFNQSRGGNVVSPGVATAAPTIVPPTINAADILSRAMHIYESNTLPNFVLTKTTTYTSTGSRMEPRTSVVNIWYRASDQSYRIDVPSAKVYGVVARIGGSVAEDAQRWPRLSLLALQVVVRIDGVAEDGIYKPSDVSACFVSNDNQALAPRYAGSEYLHGRVVDVLTAESDSRSCGWAISKSNLSFTLWVDRATGFALKLEGATSDGNLVYRDEITSFQTGVALDPSLFVVTALATSTPPTDATVSPTVAGYNPTPPLNPSLEKVGWVGNVSSLVFTYTSYNYFTDTDKTVIYYQAPYRWRVENNGVVSYQQNERSINQEPLTLSSLDLSFDFALPGDCYNPAQTVGNDTVAGRRVRVKRAVANINPCNFQGRTYYTDTVWIDLETGIALKREGLDGKGTIVHSQEVTGIQVNVPLDPSLFNTR